MTTDQIARLIYSENSNSPKSASVIARRRLNGLLESEDVCTTFRGLGLSNLWYSPKRKVPKNVEHLLLISECLIRLKETGLTFKLTDVLTEVPFDGHIRSDLVISEALYGNIPVSLIVEVENSKSISETKLKALEQVKMDARKGKYSNILPNSVMVLIIDDKRLSDEWNSKFFYSTTEFENITCIIQAIQRVILKLEKPEK